MIRDNKLSTEDEMFQLRMIKEYLRIFLKEKEEWKEYYKIQKSCHEINIKDSD